MTVWINPIAEESETDVQPDGRIVTSYSRTYQYRTDSMTRPTAFDIYADIGITPGSPYPDDSSATANKASIGPGPEMTRPPFLCYHVKFGWATNAPLPAENSTDPTTRRVLWSIKPTIQSRYVTRDRNDLLIVNTAEQPFDGGIPVDVRLGTVVAKKVVDAVGFDKALVLRDSGKLNSVTYLGAEPGTLQVDIEADEAYEGSAHFWNLTYTFSWDPQGWQPQPLSAGFYQKVSGALVRIQQDGEDVQEPEPLTETGLLVPIGLRPAGCHFITVDYFDTMDFADFHL